MTTKKTGENDVLRCSFCNKDQNDVRKLIAGPTVFICDECVEVCNDIIADDNKFDRGTRSTLPMPVEIKKFLDEYVIGQAASMAAVLLAAGAKNKRFSLPNSRILIHQPWMSGIAGQASDIDIHAREILRMRERLNEILAHHSGQPITRIQEDTDRDYIMGPTQAKDYGIIDDVLIRRA